VILLLAAMMITVTATVQTAQHGAASCTLNAARSRQAVCGWKLRGPGYDPYVRYPQELDIDLSGVPARWRPLVRDQFSWWAQQVRGVSFREPQSCSERCLSVRWTTLETGGPYAVLGRAYYPCYSEPGAGDIEINARIRWEQRPDDLIWVMRHEIGHALGLGHSKRGLMAPGLDPEQRYLPLADRVALGEMYTVEIQPGRSVWKP